MRKIFVILFIFICYRSLSQSCLSDDHIYVSIDSVTDQMKSGCYHPIGIEFSIASTKNAPQLIPLYRFYNNKERTHLWTINPNNEILTGFTKDYGKDGICGYVLPLGAASKTNGYIVTIYRYYNRALNNRFYTTAPHDPTAINSGYTQIDPAFCAWTEDYQDEDIVELYSGSNMVYPQTETNNDVLAKILRHPEVNKEIDDVKNTFTQYFLKVAKVAHDRWPVYKNAANGNFRNDMVGKDVEILSTSSLQPTSQKATKLLAVFKTFASINQTAFKNNTNYELPFAYCCGTVDYVGALLDMLKLGNDIENLSDDNSDQSQWDQTEKDVTNLYNTIKNENSHSGANANGHISEGVNSAANAALSSLKKFDFAPSTKAGRIKTVLLKCFGDIINLQTVGHNPWLKPDWQISYYIILQATAEKLEDIQ